MAMLAMGACGGEHAEHADHAPLHFDVVVKDRYIEVFVSDPARPDAVNQQPFAHPGECDVTSDAWFCDGECPGEWLGAMRLEQDGATLAEGSYDGPTGGGVGLVDTTRLDHAQLVIADMDGVEVTIPIPDVARPVPTIDDVTVTGTGTPQPEDVAITWHTTPAAASAVVHLVEGGLGGPRCHLTRDADVTQMQGYLEDSANSLVVVTAFAPPSLVPTDFGDAEVWVGGLAFQDVPTP